MAAKKASAKRAAKTAQPVRAASKAKTKPAQSAAAKGEGSTAPAFALQDDQSREVTSKSLAGKPYVLYFYPKDDTSGCTREACDFRDNLATFNSRKVRVLGVSPDSVESHVKFKKKYGLTFTLLSDPDKVLANAYGVWVKKQNYGREYMGIERSTFVVDKTGTVRAAFRKVRVDGHVAKVLEQIAAG
ncbi:MAG TPA: thioredoxin-dependent thiol peroxidase [Polyangiaceae bacterium]|jgi:peroxiredoxin Q/BCP